LRNDGARLQIRGEELRYPEGGRARGEGAKKKKMGELGSGEGESTE